MLDDDTERGTFTDFDRRYDVVVMSNKTQTNKEDMKSLRINLVCHLLNKCMLLDEDFKCAFKRIMEVIRKEDTLTSDENLICEAVESLKWESDQEETLKTLIRKEIWEGVKASITIFYLNKETILTTLEQQVSCIEEVLKKNPKPYCPHSNFIGNTTILCIVNGFKRRDVSRLNDKLNYGNRELLEKVMTSLAQNSHIYLENETNMYGTISVLWNFIKSGAKNFSNEKEILTHLKKNIKRFVEDDDIYV